MKWLRVATTLWQAISEQSDSRLLIFTFYFLLVSDSNFLCFYLLVVRDLGEKKVKMETATSNLGPINFSFSFISVMGPKIGCCAVAVSQRIDAEQWLCDQSQLSANQSLTLISRNACRELASNNRLLFLISIFLFILSFYCSTSWMLLHYLLYLYFILASMMSGT